MDCGALRVVATPSAGAGDVRFTLSSVIVVDGRLRPGGPPVGVAVDRPVRAVRLTFDVAAGRRLYLAAPGSIPLGCGALVVLDVVSRRIADAA